MTTTDTYDIQRKTTAAPNGATLELSGVAPRAAATGGDVFEWRRLDDDRIALCIADVVGCGAAARPLARRLRAGLQRVSRLAARPQALCRRLNRVLCAEFADREFATAFYAVIDRRRGRMVYTRAGHTPGLLVRADGSVERLLEGGGLLGAFPWLRFTQGEVELRPGDRLLLYTDGLTEATDATGDALGERRVAELLARHRRLDASALRRVLLQAVTDLPRPARDDVTVGVVAVGDGDPGLLSAAASA